MSPIGDLEKVARISQLSSARVNALDRCGLKLKKVRSPQLTIASLDPIGQGVELIYRVTGLNCRLLCRRANERVGQRELLLASSTAFVTISTVTAEFSITALP